MVSPSGPSTPNSPSSQRASWTAIVLYAPRPDATIIDKATYSCVNEGLIDRLRRGAVSRVHLCGIGTDSSVMMSAIDLFEAGIEPVVLAHACGSAASHADHRAGLQILKRLIGDKQVIGS